jgi:hypothetical protein
VFGFDVLIAEVFMTDTPAGVVVAARLAALRTDTGPPVKSPSLFDLIRGPRGKDCSRNPRPWGEVLLDILTGVSPQPGDLRLHLEGAGILDRDRNVTLPTAGLTTGFTSLSPDPSPWRFRASL